MEKVSLKGVIDMHVHTNPDIRLRAYDDLELTDAAVRAGARAIVIKSHQGTTAERAALCNSYNMRKNGNDGGFTMFGSITLNRVVGGINPVAVETAFKLGAKVVWLPTASARNHLEKNHLSTERCVDVIRDGKVLPELKEVFGLIREYNGVLGTAHIAPAECFRVVEAARQEGVKNIVVTHPEWWLVGMTMEDQIRLVKDYDVILERCYAQNMGGGRYESNLASNVELILEAGYTNVMTDTDGGQVENPRWEFAMEEYMQYLVDHHIPAEHVEYMAKALPAKLLGI